jgi:hypothetical protein
MCDCIPQTMNMSFFRTFGVFRGLFSEESPMSLGSPRRMKIKPLRSQRPPSECLSLRHLRIYKGIAHELRLATKDENKTAEIAETAESPIFFSAFSASSAVIFEGGMRALKKYHFIVIFPRMIFPSSS